MDRRRRGSTWSSWAPLAVTASVAAIGVAAWVWNERRQDDEDRPGPGRPYGGPPTHGGMYTDAPAVPFAGASYGSYPIPGEYTSRSMEDDGIVNRVSGALRRTPSPQQLLDGASKRVAAGMAAAGAAVGGALASIREEDKKDYEDHSRWSEEAARSGKKSRRKAKRVAIVLSAETSYQPSDDAEFHHEEASVLSHLGGQVDESMHLSVLIFDPSQSVSSSNIGTPEEVRSKKYQTLYTQARGLVHKDSRIVPFSTPDGYISVLRSQKVDTVYLPASLAGPHGERLDAVHGAVSQIVVVVGDESGHGGLVDSEDERGEHQLPRWWLDDSRIGLGKGIEVVEGLRLGEDFRRRVGGHD